MMQVSRKVPPLPQTSSSQASPSSTLQPLIVSNAEQSLYQRRYSNNDSCCTTQEQYHHQHHQQYHQQQQQQQQQQQCHQQQQYHCSCTSNKCIAFIVLVFVITMTILQIPSNNQYLLLFNPSYENNKNHTTNSRKNEFLTKTNPSSSTSSIRTKSPTFQQLDSFPTTSFAEKMIDDSHSSNNKDIHILNRHNHPIQNINTISNTNNNNNNNNNEEEEEEKENDGSVVDEENETEENGNEENDEEQDEEEVEEEEDEEEVENDDNQKESDDDRKGNDDKDVDEEDVNDDSSDGKDVEKDEEDVNDDNNNDHKTEGKEHVKETVTGKNMKNGKEYYNEKGDDDNKEKEEEDDKSDGNEERNYDKQNEPHWEENLTPQVVWLVSYPNSGTSYTMTLVERASNLSTATNYGSEVTYKDHDAIPIYPNHEVGPFWEGSSDHAIQLNRIQRPLPTNYVLTKTHCGGRCIKCPASEYLVNTTRQFLYGCQKTSYRYHGTMITTEFGVPISSIKRMIHLIRNPYHNVVARFHLERKNMIAKDSSYESLFPYDATGFYNWCHYLDTTYNYDDSKLLPKHIYQSFFDQTSDQYVTCAAEFYKWTQWHNYAIQSPLLLGLPKDRTETIRIEQSDDDNNDSSSKKRKVTTTKEKSIPAHTVYYEDYEMNFNTTFNNIMEFLQLPIATEQIRTFRSLPTYDDHYTKQQRYNIKKLIQNVATKQTWKLIQHYF
jgi:hypothetical protein